MSWTLLNQVESQTLYCWFPGWSFSAEVFSPLYQQLPGCHLAADYIAADSLEQYAKTLANDLQQICIQQSAKQIIFIGWSLGGALAIHTLKQFQMVSETSVALITLATGERFLQEPEVSTQGMELETFAAFSENLEKFPAKTTKRFLGLCTQYANAPRELMRELANAQLSDEKTLIKSLSWLNYPTLPQVDAPQKHWYSTQDGFNPRRLTPASESSQASHCFFLTESGQKELLNSIRSLLSQVDTGGAC